MLGFAAQPEGALPQDHSVVAADGSPGPRPRRITAGSRTISGVHGSELRLLNCYTRTRKWAEFHQVKQDVLLRIIEIIDRHGAQIAFPTSTVHIQGGIPMGEETVEPSARGDEEQPPGAP